MKLQRPLRLFTPSLLINHVSSRSATVLLLSSSSLSVSSRNRLGPPLLQPSAASTLTSTYQKTTKRSLITMIGESESRATLVKPPAIDPEKSAIENVLELTELAAIGPDIFSNTRPLWHPPGARGIYGGAVIAQCLAAAQHTVPSNFTVHSMHCYFVLAGDATIPVLYHVEHVREGKSFATRTVQARQRGKCIFTTTMSFVRENSGGKKLVSHAAIMPSQIEKPADDGSSGTNLIDGGSPFESRRIEILNSDSAHPHEKRTRQWIRAKGRISPGGGHQAHLSALAYMSDSYFIGTVSRIHNLWRFSDPNKPKVPKPASVAEDVAKDDEEEDEKAKAFSEYLRIVKEAEGFGDDLDNKQGRPEVGMMVSLDHSIYFHEPRKFRADEWMFTEMESPWAGDGRGVVQQKMFASDGTLVATCFQEGVVRLKQDPSPQAKL